MRINSTLLHLRNVGLTKVSRIQRSCLGRSNIQIEIWERGAGYTLASGSSSCAAAVVAHRLGLCDAQIVVHMPGGEIDISIAQDFVISMTGNVSKVCEGIISHEMFDRTKL